MHPYIYAKTIMPLFRSFHIYTDHRMIPNLIGNAVRSQCFYALFQSLSSEISAARYDAVIYSASNIVQCSISFVAAERHIAFTIKYDDSVFICFYALFQSLSSEISAVRMAHRLHIRATGHNYLRSARQLD